MQKQARFGVILPAAGAGTRFGGGDKLLADLAGRTVLQRSVELFARRKDVAAILIATGRDRFDGYRAHVQGFAAGVRLEFVEGGRERWESVLFALRRLAQMDAAPQCVAVHDAARPFCPPEVIEEAFRVTVEKGAALPCMAEPATLKRRGAEGHVAETIDRRSMFQAQTPQCFDFRKLLQGYERLLAEGRLADVTDDAQVFERMGWPVPITAGAVTNLKITGSEDVALARAIALHWEKPAS